MSVENERKEGVRWIRRFIHKTAVAIACLIVSFLVGVFAVKIQGAWWGHKYPRAPQSFLDSLCGVIREGPSVVFVAPLSPRHLIDGATNGATDGSTVGPVKLWYIDGPRGQKLSTFFCADDKNGDGIPDRLTVRIGRYSVVGNGLLGCPAPPEREPGWSSVGFMPTEAGQDGIFWEDVGGDGRVDTIVRTQLDESTTEGSNLGSSSNTHVVERSTLVDDNEWH
jgi:hypothetical protein